MLDTGFLMGMRVQQSPFALKRTKKVELIQHPLRKRRRNWAVKVTYQDKPAIIKLGDHTLICHPTLYQKLASEFAAKETPQ